MSRKPDAWRSYAAGSEVRHFAGFCCDHLIQSEDRWEGKPLALDSGRVVHRFESVVLGATLALIPVFVIEAEATTVGYGDITPKSVDGRIIAMVVMLFGIGFLSVLTATVASLFVKTERAEETEAILDALTRLEAELAEVKHRLSSPS